MTTDEPLDTATVVEAPEHIVFRYAVAGPGRRAVAHVLDLLVCYSALAIVTVLILVTTVGLEGATGGNGSVGESLATAGIGLWLVVLFASQWVYMVLWEGLTGRSPGKMAVGLRVVTVQGQPIGLGAAALRNVLRAADVLPGAYLVGLVAMALGRRFQRIGDLVAGTMVIVVRRAGQAAPLALSPPPDRLELAVLPPEAPLDLDEREAIELFLRRRATLGRAREEELASLMMQPLKRRFGFCLPDPSRTLALLYDRAVNAGRTDAPPSSRAPTSGWLTRRPPPRSP